MNPLVVVGICTCNNCKSLERTLESVKKIDYDNFKIIVVDNNSTDDTRTYLKNIGGIEYIYESKQGISNARNRLLDSCGDEVEYLGMLDDDETVEPTWIKEMLKCFSLDKQIVAVGSVCLPVYEKPINQWVSEDFFAVGMSWKGMSIYEDSLPGGNLMIKMSIFKKTTYRYNSSLRYSGKVLIAGEDVEFSENMKMCGYKLGFTEFAPVKHYIPEKKSNIQWVTKRYFCEGITQYYRYGFNEWLHGLWQLPLRFLRLILELMTLNVLKIRNRFYKLVMNLGLVFGPIILCIKSKY